MSVCSKASVVTDLSLVPVKMPLTAASLMKFDGNFVARLVLEISK